MTTLKSHQQMSESTPVQLRHLVQAYSLYENLIGSEAEEDQRFMYVLQADQLQRVEARRASEIKLGLKFLELITYNFVVVDRQATEEGFEHTWNMLQKWIKERYGDNHRNVYLTMAKVFYNQDQQLIRGIKRDFEMQILKFRYKQFLSANKQEKKVEPIEISNMSSSTVKLVKQQTEQESSGSQFSQSMEQQPEVQHPQKKIDERSVLSEMDTKLILDKMKSLHQKIQQESDGQVLKQPKSPAFHNQSSISSQKPQGNKSTETTRSQMPIHFEVDCYLSQIKYPKHELTEFCHQLGFPEPQYTNRGNPKDKDYTVGCRMNFTSEYTKFASRYYHAEDVSATYRKAEELAASRVLRIIYTKHKDLWQKFKEIKASKNIKPN